jgi:arylsulfatase A-like enzyme
VKRRGFLGLLGLGTAAADALAREVAQRIEDGDPGRALQFVNRKTGAHPFRAAGGGSRPSVVLITLDMVSPDHHHRSRRMHREMELPTIRALAGDGVVFHNAFCVSPLCAPARAVLATGRYSYITANAERAHDGHEVVLRPSDVIFPEYLKATGYRTKHAGKGHLGTQKYMDAFDENDNAWDRWAPPIQDDELYLAHLRRLGVKQQRYRREIVGLWRDRKTPQTSLGGWIEQADGNPFPLEAQYSYYLALKALEKIDAARAEGGQPFYLQLDIFDPHQPFSIPHGFEEREKALRAAPEVTSLPASYERVRARDWKAAADEPKVYNFYARSWGLYDPETVRTYRVANALQMEVVDRALAVFIKGLRDRGLYDETLILLTADHGEMNGRRAVVDKGVYLFPDVLRVPLVVKMPASAGVKAHGVEAPVSHLDVAPTLLGLAGIEVTERLDGRSLLPHLDGSSSPADRALLFECGWHTGVNFACAVQRWDPNAGHHLYTYNLSSDVDELYDLAASDAENLAARPEHRRLRSEMVERMAALLAPDPRWRGYWHSFQVDHAEDLPAPERGDRQMVRPR